MNCLLFDSLADVSVISCRSILRVVVDDGESTATFELPDYLLQGIPSLSYNNLVRHQFFILLLCCNMLCLLSFILFFFMLESFMMMFFYLMKHKMLDYLYS